MKRDSLVEVNNLIRTIFKTSKASIYIKVTQEFYNNEFLDYLKEFSFIEVENKFIEEHKKGIVTIEGLNGFKIILERI